MGTVWRAWDERLQREVAIKQVLSEFVARARGRLRREARAAARLNHPHIVHIYDLVEREDGDWIVMELVEGRTLRQLLDAEGPLPLSRFLDLGLEIAAGLTEAHGHGILHRDLKAGNIMVTSGGHAKILDFGLAKDLRDTEAPADQEVSLSTPGMVIGTCHAMSPEQVQGTPLDARSDLFSLGSLFYEALDGDPPFRGQTPWESLARVLSLRPRPLAEVRPEVPKELSDLIGRMLEKEPPDRPQSIREVIEVLAFCAGRRGAAGPASSDSSQRTSERLWRAAATADSALPATTEALRPAAERRKVTVVCCGLVGVGDTGEIRGLDVEDLSAAMASFQSVATFVAEQLGGCLGTVLGNRLCLYFGYPQSYEDNAERAVLAARLLGDRAEQIKRPAGAGWRKLGARTAVHTGPAVVDPRPGQDGQIQLGSTLDTAMALQGFAPLREVLVSDGSRRLLARSYGLEPLEPVRLPESGETVAVYRLLQALDPREGDGRSPLLVGRERELELLLDRLRLARAGTGQAVMILGEGGIGKSRLVQGLRDRIPAGTVTWLVGYGSPYTQGTPLAPVVDLVERSFFSAAKESPEQRLAHLEELIRRFGFPLDEAVPLLASLLSLPTDGRYPPLDMTPEAQRNKTLETVVGLLAAMAEIQPVVLLIEDLHWIDPTSRELLDLLIEDISSLPLMLVVTSRPERQITWRNQSRITQISLSRLTDEETEQLIEKLTGGRDLPSGMRRQISSKTDGVPLFIEELTKAVLEASWSGEHPDIPSTLDGSLMARLDRLGDAKRVAQLASVIGRVFSRDLLAAVAQLDETVLRRGLDELLQAELLYRRGAGPRARYVFKHALIQDAAYLSLLSSHRQQIHERIARFLEQEPQRSPEHGPEVLAHHFEKADLPFEAATYLRQAALHALQRSAFDEALSHCRRGIELLAGLPRSRETAEQELELRSAMGVALMPSKGYVSSEVEENAAQSQALCRELGDTPRLLMSLYRLWTYHVLRRSREPAMRLAKEIGQLAQGGDEGQAFIGLSVQATTLFYIGIFRDAEALLEKAMDVYQPALFPSLAQRFGDHCITPCFYHAWCIWIGGRPDRAMLVKEDALQALHGTTSVFVRVTGLFFEMVLWRELREPDHVLRLADQLIPLCRDNVFPFYLAWATCGQGWALAHRGEARRGLEMTRQVYAKLPGGYILTYLLDLYLHVGEIEEGLAAVEKGLALTQVQLDQFYEAELHRLHGELLLRKPDPKSAEEAFRQSLTIARDQGARLFELRAAVSLSRHLRAQNRAAEARPLLAAVYEGFQEGFATRDLMEARELLGELAG
jgi:TOMM system kinase/cyclase fusion protein